MSADVYWVEWKDGGLILSRWFETRAKARAWVRTVARGGAVVLREWKAAPYGPNR